LRLRNTETEKQKSRKEEKQSKDGNECSTHSAESMWTVRESESQIVESQIVREVGNECSTHFSRVQVDSQRGREAEKQRSKARKAIQYALQQSPGGQSESQIVG